MWLYKISLHGQGWCVVWGSLLPCNTRYERCPATPEVAWSRVSGLGRGGAAPTAPAITTWCCDFRPATTSGISRQSPDHFFQGGEMSEWEEIIIDRDFLFPMVKTSLLLFYLHLPPLDAGGQHRVEADDSGLATHPG